MSLDWLRRSARAFVAATLLVFVFFTFVLVVAVLLKKRSLAELGDDLVWALLCAVLFGFVVALFPPSRKSLGESDDD